ncbi:MAG: ribonuclease P [Methanomicrobia archaeon]|nr:ribonuclease P [Methanomicrobia archaeon]
MTADMGIIMSVLLYLLPSLRERKRYLRFELMGEREIDKRELMKEIWDSIYSLYGDVGASESKLWLIEYHRVEDRKEEESNLSVGVLRCAHNKVEAVRASLACIHTVNDARVGIRVIRTSGSIKGASRRS